MINFLRIRQAFFVAFFFLSNFFLWAADPTTSASNVQFPSASIDGAQFKVSFTAGNGTGGRIVVVKEGSEITGVPVDGTRYEFNSAFGTAGTQFTAPGEYVVAHLTGSTTSVTVTNLKPGTTYYVAIFELNGNYATPSTIDYSIVTPTDKKVTTLSAPTTQTTITGFTQVAGNSVRVNWTSGGGQGRLIVATKGTSLTATPTQLASYNYSRDFGSTTGSSYWLSPDVFVVYKISNTYTNYADINGLEPNTAYTFAAFEFNGDITPVYLTPASIQTITTHAGPTQAFTNISFDKIEGNRLDCSWSGGNGSQSLVVIKKGSPVSNVPENGKSYTSNTVFGSSDAEWVPGSGEYVVSFSTRRSVSITGLEKSIPYYISIFAFDADKNGYTYYYSTPLQKTQNTAMPPTGQTTVTVTAITGSSAQLNYQSPASGGGNSRLLVIRDGSPVEFLPEDLKVYGGATSTYGMGQLVGPDTYTLYGQSNGGAPNVKGLIPGHTYYTTVFEMNGTTAPVYLRPGASVQINIPNEPTTASYNGRFSSVEGNSMRFDWQNGDGANRIVVVRKGTAVTSVPQDGTSYLASDKLGEGSELTAGQGEFVVYNGSYSTVTVTGLEKNTTYHFAIFEYSPSGTGPDYLTASGKWLTASQATVSAPSTQTSNLIANDIQSNQASFTFTTGNGASRIFVMREGAAVDAEPQDYTRYTYNKNFGTSGTQLGTANYFVNSGNTAFTITNLKPGTQYYITAFEFNGNAAPVYLRPGATMYSFTTTGGVVVTAPAQAASGPALEKIDGTSFNFKWTNGDGANRIVIARKGSPVSFVPVNGTGYSANAAFGSNTDLGQGQYVVFNGTGNVLALTNLELATSYYFAVYEYNGSGTTIRYGTVALTASGTTATSPTVKSSNPSNTTTSNSITLSWTSGNGAGRIVVAREGSEVSAVPSNLSKYKASNVFKDGPQLAVGQYVVYSGTGSSVTVTGLEANKNYHFSVFEYNGVDAPVYNTTDVLKTTAIIGSVLPVTWLSFAVSEKNGKVMLDWTTTQEINADAYVVERSLDGIRFTPVLSLQAKGGEGRNTYSATDPAAGSATLYYRIKQVDANGKFSYSNVLRLAINGTPALKLLQNPIQNQLGFECSEEWLGGRFEITDASGRTIYKGEITTTINRVALKAGSFGIWYLTVYSKTGQRVSLPFVRL
ncbi:MAG: hypothetical protein J7502_03980 [Flavisolibacter sp.]|nr:hypothetical protein [Flavisolibacter sp.]